MRFNMTGKLADNFYVAGSAVCPIYILNSEKPVLFDAGFTALSNAYISDIQHAIGNLYPNYLFITHAHFDHVGSAGYLKTHWENMKIAASQYSHEILKRPGALDLISNLNRQSIDILETLGIQNLNKKPFIPFGIDRIIYPEENISILPGLTVKAFHTPGHTRDFFSYWIPEKRILIASEAVGCADGLGGIQTEFIVDYDEYIKGLKLLQALNPSVLCTGHRLVLTGADVPAYFNKTLSATYSFFNLTAKILNENNGNVEHTVTCIKQLEWDKRPHPKQPEKAYLLNTRHRVLTIQKKLAKFS